MSGFNEVYYSFSPGVADLEMENPAFRDAVRTAITPGVYTLGIMTLADHNSEQSVTLFGILTLAAIGGIYIGGPGRGGARRHQGEVQNAGPRKAVRGITAAPPQARI